MVQCVELRSRYIFIIEWAEYDQNTNSKQAYLFAAVVEKIGIKGRILDRVTKLCEASKHLFLLCEIVCIGFSLL